MKVEQLVSDAAKLKTPSKKAAQDFAAHRGALVAELNKRMLAREDLEQLIGPGNQKMMQDNSHNMMRFMGTMLQAHDPEVHVQTVLWVFRAYRSHGFQLTYWAANLNTVLEVFKDELAPETMAEVAPFFEWMIVNIPSFTALSDAQLGQGEPR